MFGYQVLGFGSGGVTPVYVAASGGTESTSGNFKIHTFTGPGTFTVNEGGNQGGVEYLIVGGLEKNKLIDEVCAKKKYFLEKDLETFK